MANFDRRGRTQRQQPFSAQTGASHILPVSGDFLTLREKHFREIPYKTVFSTAAPRECVYDGTRRVL